MDIYKHLLPRMKDLIIDSMLSVKDTMNPMRRKNCFELFGYDFLIDEDFRIWLLEVNSNPYLGIPNEFISSLLPEMIDDLLQITVDILYPPKISTKNRENRWELLYCDDNSWLNPTPIN